MLLGGGPLSAAQATQHLAEMDTLVRNSLGGSDVVKAVATTTTPWQNVVREDLEPTIYLAPPTDAPLSTRFNRIKGEGTFWCPNMWEHMAAWLQRAAGFVVGAICRKSPVCCAALIAGQ